MSSGFAFGHGDPIAPVILGTTSILAFAIAGRVAARRLGQPTVLGELLMGILIGNLGWYFGNDLMTILREGPRMFDIVHQCLSGASMPAIATELLGTDRGPELVRILNSPRGGELMQVAHTVDVFSRYGIIFMLFMVGLGTELDDLRRVGADSVRVAIIGVAVPVALGFFATELLRPGIPLPSALFIAATLGATSVGITSNVLEEMDRLQSREGHIVLGAAVYDDIMGLILLAVVSGIVVSGSVDIVDIGIVVALSAIFIGVTIAVGRRIAAGVARILSKLDLVEAKMFTSYLFVMLLAWAANLAGLATIIGAFAAGVVMHDRIFRRHRNHGDSKPLTVRELITPLEVILVPIFFILMGIQVKLESFASWPVVILAGGLLVAATIGKLVSGLGAAKPADRLAVGVGMLPRGEVGLVFAAIGRTLGVIDDSIFAAIVLMVIVTTLAAPPWLKAVLSKPGSQGAAA